MSGKDKETQNLLDVEHRNSSQEYRMLDLTGATYAFVGGVAGYMHPTGWILASIMGGASAYCEYDHSGRLEEKPLHRLFYTASPLLHVAAGWLTARAGSAWFGHDPSALTKTFVAAASTICALIPTIHIERGMYALSKKEHRPGSSPTQNTGAESPKIL